MFQNFANYLLGSFLNQTDDNGANTARGVEDDSCRFKSEVRDDDWVLVVRDSDACSDDDDVDDDVDDDEKVEGRRSRPLTRTSSTSSMYQSPGMEESWFITPPPCFTSQGPVHMETSPLENLLIEHPSMSVYHIHPKGRQFFVTMPSRSASSDSCGSNEEDSEVEDIEVLVEEPEAAAVEERLPQLNRQHVLQEQDKQGHKSKRAQKVQMKQAYRSLKRGNLERNNKAREVNSRNRRQRRGERSQGATRSHANNNRKC